MRRRRLYRTRRQNNRIWNNQSKLPICDIFLIASEQLRLLLWFHRCFQPWDMLVLSQWITKLNDERPLSAWIFCWQPPLQQFFGVLLRATFCSGALLQQPSHRVVSDPFSCQIQNRDAEMKKAKRLLLLRRVLDRVNIFEWLVRLHVKFPVENQD